MTFRIALAGVLAVSLGTFAAQEKKGEARNGTVTGEVTAKGDNWIEVKADGEEKARRYVPHWKGGQPKDGGGPDKDVVAKIEDTPLKSRIKLDWEFEERARVVKIEVLKKPDEKKDEKRSGTIAGEIKSMKEQNNNLTIEVLAPRRRKGPLLLRAVRREGEGADARGSEGGQGRQGRGQGRVQLGGHQPRPGDRQVRGGQEARREEVRCVSGGVYPRRAAKTAGVNPAARPPQLEFPSMNRVLAGLALVLLPGVAEAQNPRKTDPTKFGWVADYDAAKAEAERTGKPIFLVFRCEP